MSLHRQLWLAILALTLLAFACSFLVSTFNARHYLEQQLTLKNQDNANALAVAMSQQKLDPVTAELLLAAQFDAGHYAAISLSDPQGKVFVERHNPISAAGAPLWFCRLIPITATAGSARIQQGWHQFGTLSLKSDSSFAYVSLWRATNNLLIWFCLGGLTCGLIGSLILRSILRPLAAIVEQAEAIGERRFLHLHLPRTLEFRQVASAMNRLSDRVRALLETETERLDQLRRQVQHDPLTGLLSRQQFLNRLESALDHADSSASGALLIGRFDGLDNLNRSLGRAGADYLLQRIGTQITELLEQNPTWAAGRIAGADFALLAPGVADVLDIARQLSSGLHLAVDRSYCGEEHVLPVGGTSFNPGEPLAQVLARCDGALLDAERRAGLAVQVAPEKSFGLKLVDHASWKELLEKALQAGKLRLGRYPVLDSRGTLLHYESPARLQLNGAWQPAAVFIAWAGRLGLLPRLDALVFKTALADIRSQNQPLGVHLSPETLYRREILDEMAASLRRNPELAGHLWLEVPENGVFDQMPAFRHLCQQFKPLGCKIGIEHAGLRLCHLSELHDLGIDYIKIDASLIRNVDCNPGTQHFLRGLCMIAHSIGLEVIAEGVQSSAEWQSLPPLGLGATGPAIMEES